MENKKPHISPSQVASYTRCGESYRRRYIENEVIPPSISLTKGTSIHRGSQYSFEKKIETRRDLPANEVVDYSVSEFESKIEKQGLLLSQEEESRGKTIVVGEGKDSTAALARVMMAQVHPKYQPRAVEKEVFVELPSSSHNLKGYIDVETDKDQIIDLKTSAKAWNQERVNRDFQFTFYSMLYRSLHKKDPDVVVENLVDSRTKTRSLTFVSERDSRDYEAAVYRLNGVLAGINAEIYVPANDGAWWCDARYCGYYQTCRYTKK